MGYGNRAFIPTAVLVFLISSISLAKGRGPREVAPVVHDGIKYVAVHWGRGRGLEQNGGYIEAFDLNTGRPLWLLRVYSITYDNREKDVQDIFITELSIEQGQLLVTNDRGEKFSVNLKTGVVTQVE